MLDRIPTPLYSTAAVAVSLTGLLLLAGVGSPGPDGAADVPEGPLMQAERGPAAPGDGTAEGIKVHGHWTIEVREPDGELVTRREFENALQQSGGVMLAELLGRVASFGRWEIHLLSGVCQDTGFGPRPCIITEDTYPVDGPFIFKTLTMTAVEGSLRFEGTATPQVDGAIAEVRTLATWCDQGISPEDCAVGSGIAERTITATNIERVAVEANQLIVVRVEISFS